MDRRRFLTYSTLPAAAGLLVRPRKGRRLTRTITDDAGSSDMPRAYAVRVGSVGSSQSPVALVAADGEIISGSGASATQSNFTGNGFWGRNSFTFARDWSGPNPLGGTFSGFDDPTFVPIGVWLLDFDNTNTAMFTRLKGLGINGGYPWWTSGNPVTHVSQGMWGTCTVEQYAAASAIPSGGSSAVMGILTGEEPSDDTAYNAIVNPAVTWLAGTGGTGRFHQFNFADHAFDPNLWGSSITQAQAVAEGNPSPRKRISTADMYWYAGSTGGSNSALTKLPFRMYQHLSMDATQDQGLRGCHYGSAIDALRRPFTGAGIPLGTYLENGAPFDEAITHEITAAELKWAQWSIFVHGGRIVEYFNHTFRAGDPNAGNNNFGNDYYGGPGVTGNGVFAAAQEVNLNALRIAPAINGPRDGHFVWGTTSAVSQTGFMTAVTSTNARSAYAGVEASCRWNPLDSKHYILATTRESGTATNVPITIDMVDQGQAQATPAFGGTPISITRPSAGVCRFTDTFASARDYRAWKIE